MDIMGIFLMSTCGLLILSVIILAVFCIYHFNTDPYDMKSSMRKLNDFQYDGFVSTLTDIIAKMEKCPTVIPQHVPPIEVFDNAKYKLLIVGDAAGKPRLFAFTVYETMAEYEYVQLRNKDKRFKRFGLKHSIDVEEVKKILENAEKRTFKAKLEETQEREIYKFFRK